MVNREEIRVCILRAAGTNCDAETKRACENSGLTAEIVHLNQLARNSNLLEYQMLIIPGGFSHGDYVRAGAIWAKQILIKLGKDLERFMNEERPILGICNGFQVLVEAGLLPQFGGIAPFPEAALGTNVPIGYCCRWIYLRHQSKGNCVFTGKIPQYSVVQMPVAHAEGRFMFRKDEEDSQLEKLIESDQLVFRYCHPDGQSADGKYPENPNGAFSDIAGVCSPTGTVFGLMPHPERAYFGWELPSWTRCETFPLYGDGRLIFESITHHLTRKL
jgi:phosphoribosylformylglycinamidine synthase I